MRVLEHALETGAVHQRDLMKDADGMGISKTTLQRAKKALRVDSVKEAMAGGSALEIAHEDCRRIPKMPNKKWWIPSRVWPPSGGFRCRKRGALMGAPDILAAVRAAGIELSAEGLAIGNAEGGAYG